MQLLKDSIPHQAIAKQIAELYRLHMIRMRDEDDSNFANDAWPGDCHWAGFYASLATSDGEAAALSYERDQFRVQLGPKPF